MVLGLSRGFVHWLPQIAETWTDRIDQAWPLNLYIVQPPAPVTKDRAVEQLQVLVVQRSLTEHLTKLFTILDNTAAGLRVDVAAFGPLRVGKEAAITVTNYQHRCYP